MNYIYRNDTNHAIIYRNYHWLPNDQIATSFPVPEQTGLTCIQVGASPDPVLFHDDIVLQPGEKYEVLIDAPTLSHNVSLSIQCMTNTSGAICRFNHANNKPIPIDARSFEQIIPWELCSRIFLENLTNIEAIISITAIETCE